MSPIACRDGPLAPLLIPGWDQLSALPRGASRRWCVATLLVRDQAVAEELVQEAFVRLHPKLASVEQPGAYLRTTVVNLCRGHGRRSATAAAHPAGPAGRVQRCPTTSARALAMADSERQRHALVLRFYLDLPDDQIASLLDARTGHRPFPDLSRPRRSPRWSSR